MSEQQPHVVLSDDLVRSRLTVFFRLFLVIPHLLWAGLIGSAVAVVVLIDWFILLARGTSPDGLHDMLAGYVRYLAHVEAYLFLAADPYPGFFAISDGAYPVDVEVARAERQNRWLTLFRLPLAIPAALLAVAFSGGFGGRNSYSMSGGIAGSAAFLLWFAVLARGRAPRGLRDVVVWAVGYSAQATAYILLVTDRYPYSGPEGHLPELTGEELGDHPVTMTLADDLRRSRLTVFFRLLLALPHIVWSLLWGVLVVLAALVNWVATLATGRSPAALSRFLAAYVRYTSHLSAFICLIGNPFPGFVGQAGSYPLDVAVETGARQNRWVTLFRLFLAVPAALLSAAFGSLLYTVALLAWFSSLARGRMPRGMRNAGATAIAYSAQLNAYALLLTDRYPDSTPRRLLRNP